MTGAGSGELIFGHEESLAGTLVDSDSDGTPDLFAFGRNPTIEELDLNNQLETLRNADSVWDTESIKSNFEGAVSISATVSADVHDEVEKIVFNDGGTAIKAGLSSSARVFVGVQYPSGTVERTLKGCIPTEYSIDYSQEDATVTYSLSLLYADEEPSTSVDLTTATRISDGSSVPFHGFQLDLDGTTVSDLQSCSLSLSELARFQYGTSPTPNRGVIAAPSAELTVEAILNEPTRYEIARGNATGTLPDDVDSVSATITLTADGTAVSTYSLSGVTPDSHSWNEVIGTDDTTGETQFNITDEQAVTVA